MKVLNKDFNQVLSKDLFYQTDLWRLLGRPRERAAPRARPALAAAVVDAQDERCDGRPLLRRHRHAVRRLAEQAVPPPVSEAEILIGFVVSTGSLCTIDLARSARIFKGIVMSSPRPMTTYSQGREGHDFRDISGIIQYLIPYIGNSHGLALSGMDIGCR